MAEGTVAEGRGNATGGMAEGLTEAGTGRTSINRTEGAPRRREPSTTGPAVRARIVAGQGRRPDAVAVAGVVPGRVRPHRASRVAGIRAARRRTGVVVRRSTPHHPDADPHHPDADPHHRAVDPHHRAVDPHHRAVDPHHRAIVAESAARGPLPQGVDALREGRVDEVQKSQLEKIVMAN